MSPEDAPVNSKHKSRPPPALANRMVKDCLYRRRTFWVAEVRLLSFANTRAATEGERDVQRIPLSWYATPERGINLT